MSWRALVDVGYWDPGVVSEDSRIFLQCLFRYDGDYEVTPLYTPVSMNTVYIGENRWKTIVAQYKQIRRWGWGVEHTPFMIRELFLSGKSKMSLRMKLYFIFIQSEGMYSWATAPMILFIMGRLPMWIATTRGNTSAVFYNAPHILEWLMTIAMIGLFATAIFYVILLPVRPRKYHWMHYPIMFLQWVFFPITMIIFGAIPSIDAQTRLMFGGKFRLGFNVTAKK